MSSVAGAPSIGLYWIGPARDMKLNRDVAVKVGWRGFDGEDRQLHRQVNLEDYTRRKGLQKP